MEGKVNRLSVGVYPDTTLALARRKRDDARQMLATGSDPAEAKKAQKAAVVVREEHAKLAAQGKPMPGTFQFVASEWLEKVHRIKVSVGHAERTEIRLKQDVFPWIGRKPISEVNAPDVLACLRRVEARGAIDAISMVAPLPVRVVGDTSTLPH